MEMIQGFQTIQEIKQATGKNKVIVVQPFGRSIQLMGEFLVDHSSRSFELQNIVNIIEVLRKEYAVVIMSENRVPLEEDKEHLIAAPNVEDLRLWAGIINSADHFLGCDSVGQHIAKALGKTATVVVGSTFPENISYPEWEGFDIIDIGKDNRKYSPIRMTQDDEKDRMNNDCMAMTPHDELSVIESIKKYIGDGTKFEGSFTPTEENTQCCGTIPAGETTPEYQFNTKNLLGN